MKEAKGTIFFFKSNLCIIFCIGMMLFLGACGKNDKNQATQENAVSAHEPITQELIGILKENPEVKSMLETSIEKAKEINGDKKTNPAQTLEQYYEYIDWAAKAMPWNISKDVAAEGLYEKIDQSLNYFYFINDQPLEELKGKGLYNNSLQYAEPYRSWLIKFTKEWGEYLNTEDSWNEEYYQLAYADERFGLQGEWYEGKENWNTFNQFFSRYLSSSSQRPISEKDDSSVVVSPADSTPQGVWEIDADSFLRQKEGAVIKSQTFQSVSDLIGKDSAYADDFANGVMTHTFLDVHDYHRYHFPVSGVVKEVRTIPGDDAVGGSVTWDKETNQYILDAETPGWQMIETRSCVIVDTEQYGLVALLPIGMSQVSSVNFEDTVKVGENVKKGDALGYFLFGGSDFVMVFQEKANFEITAPMERGSDSNYDHLLMGEIYGKMNR